MNRDSNKHTYIFSALMVVSVAFVLSFTSESLKDLQNANVKKEKMEKKLEKVENESYETALVGSEGLSTGTTELTSE